jgi:hypothetical protein
MENVQTTADIRAAVLDALRNALRKDIDRAPSDVDHSILGLRDTSEIAERIYPRVSTRLVARTLDQLALDEEIFWYGKLEGFGNVNFWRIATAEDDDGGDELSNVVNLLRESFPSAEHIQPDDEGVAALFGIAA